MNIKEAISQMYEDYKRIAKLHTVRSTEEMPNWNTAFTILLKLKISPEKVTDEQLQNFKSTFQEMATDLPKLIKYTPEPTKAKPAKLKRKVSKWSLFKTRPPKATESTELKESTESNLDKAKAIHAEILTTLDSVIEKNLLDKKENIGNKTTPKI